MLIHSQLSLLVDMLGYLTALYDCRGYIALGGMKANNELGRLVVVKELGGEDPAPCVQVGNACIFCVLITSNFTLEIFPICFNAVISSRMYS
jgi:hypothetical protein